jgi:hypothetical protein
MHRFLLFSALLLSTPCWAAAQVCDQPAGRAIGAVVPTATAARAIYEAIAKGRNDRIKTANNILVNDKGDYWEVFQYPKKTQSFVRRNGVETVQVVAGGGTLELEINKCDARVLGAYSR